ncbi:hypothetical protein CYMTET_30556, partial [Cymbomonas tetramitiformis]
PSGFELLAGGAQLDGTGGDAMGVGQTALADLACKCERYIGTAGGGMDQAISVLASNGVAKLVDFNPLRTQDVSLPQDATFVIANSLTVSCKADTAPYRYNLRVVECQLASSLLAVALGMDPTAARQRVTTLRHVEALTETSTSKALAAAAKYLHEHAYTADELEAILECSLESLFVGKSSALAVLAVNSQYCLYQRAEHVYTEALRVQDFRQVCIDGEQREQSVLSQLGELMSASHASCRDSYNCSSPELDRLVQICLAEGAHGARLTGAGWGGCVVALVPASKASSFMDAIQARALPWLYCGLAHRDLNGKLAKMVVAHSENPDEESHHLNHSADNHSNQN